MKYLILWLACVTLCTPLSAAPYKDYPEVEDTCFTETNGYRVIRLSVEVPAMVEEVWQTFTTSDGWKSFGVAFASVDMQVGGVIETSYSPQAKLGDPDNIKNQIVAYVPGRMLAIRCVQAPRNFEHKEEFFATATVIEMEPMEGNKARVRAYSVGFRPGKAYDDLYAKFRRGNAYTLHKLRLSFERRGNDTSGSRAKDGASGKEKTANQ